MHFVYTKLWKDLFMLEYSYWIALWYVSGFMLSSNIKFKYAIMICITRLHSGERLLIICCKAHNSWSLENIIWPNQLLKCNDI